MKILFVLTFISAIALAGIGPGGGGSGSSSLATLTDVSVSGMTDNQCLAYDTATSAWTNQTLTTDDVTESKSLYYTDARARASVSGTAPLSYDSKTGAFSIPASTDKANGYMTSTDHTSLTGLSALKTTLDSIVGLVKANSGSYSAAKAGTDYVGSESDPIVGAKTGLIVGDGKGGISATTDGHTSWDGAASHKTTEDAITGLVTVDGKGGYTGTSTTAYLPVAGTGLVENPGITVQTPEAATIPFGWQDYAGTVTYANTQCAAGSLTANFKICHSGSCTSITGCSAISADTDHDSTSCTAANTVAAGDHFQVVVSSPSSASYCMLGLKVTR